MTSLRDEQPEIGQALSVPRPEPRFPREGWQARGKGAGLAARLLSPIFWLACGAFAIALAIWEIVAAELNDPVMLVTPWQVAVNLWQWFYGGGIWPNLAASGEEFGLGFAIAFAVGVTFGIILGVNETVSRAVYPLVTALNSVPVIALAPLFVIWLGFGLAAKVVLISLIAFFPILANAEAGVRSTLQGYLDVGRSFGASWFDMIRSFRLPASVPYLLAGARVAVAKAVAGIFVGELYGSTVGIGYTISNSANVFDTARLFSSIVVLAGFGIIATTLVNWLMRLVAPWSTSVPSE